MRFIALLRIDESNAHTLQSAYRSLIPSAAIQQQKLRLCADCGAYLGIHDNDRRLADHFGGKLHMGFVFLREKLNELKKNETERRELRRKELGVSGVGSVERRKCKKLRLLR